MYKKGIALILILSFCLSALITVYYVKALKQRKHRGGIGGKGADEQITAITEYIEEQDGKPVELVPDINDSYKDSSVISLVEGIIETTESDSGSLNPSIDPEKAALILEEKIRKQRKLLEKRRQIRAQTKALENNTVLIGEHYPFKILLNPGWKILERRPNTVISWKDKVTVTVETGPWITDQEEYANKAMQQVTDNYPNMDIAEFDSVQMGYEEWLKYILQEKNKSNPRQLMVLTRGSHKGSYNIVIAGLSEDLNNNVKDITKMLKSFRFPPDNFKPPNAREVRVYIDGIRQYF